MKKILYAAYKSNVLRGTLMATLALTVFAGCLHLSLGVDKEVIPDKIESKYLDNQDAHPVEFVTYTEVDIELGKEDEYGDPVKETIKFAPRYETEKERNLQWQLDNLALEQQQLNTDNENLLKKLSEFMEIHNETVKELAKKTQREQIQAELTTMFGPVLE